MKKLLGFLLALLIFMPALTFAQGTACVTTGSNLSGFKGLLCDTKVVLDDLIIILIGAALVTFMWGLVKFISTASDKDHSEGRALMVWGIIALTVMASVGGLIFFLQSNLLGSNASKAIPLPTFTSGGSAGGTDPSQDCGVGGC